MTHSHVGDASLLPGAAWRKSSYSGQGGGDCVEVGSWTRAIAVRDSKDPGGAALLFSPTAWAEFLRGTKTGLYGQRFGS